MLELGGAVVSVLDRLDREDVRLLPLRRVIASAVGLRWVRRQHSPLVAMHHMILCARRKIFEITTKPNNSYFKDSPKSPDKDWTLLKDLLNECLFDHSKTEGTPCECTIE